MDFFYDCYTNVLKQKIISRTKKRKVNKDNPRKSVTSESSAFPLTIHRLPQISI